MGKAKEASVIWGSKQMMMAQNFGPHKLFAAGPAEGFLVEGDFVVCQNGVWQEKVEKEIGVWW